MATETATAGESALVPRPEHRFTFGLWTVGHKGSDPFGDAARPGLEPDETVRRLAGLGAHGVCFHDNDLVPLGASEHEAREIKGRFRRALDETGMQVTMATTNLFFHPAFKDGAFTANDREVRRFALQKTLRAIELGMELGAPIFVFWGGREGVEADAAKPAGDALERYREAIDFLCEYVLDRGYDMRFVENEDGIWDFAAGCMRTYLALAEKARRFDEDPDIRAARAEAKVPALARPTVGGYSREAVDELLAEEHDLGALGARACRNERLDQLVIDLLLGLR
jgi:sugar phosphate isomerase/epimerase